LKTNNNAANKKKEQMLTYPPTGGENWTKKLYSIFNDLKIYFLWVLTWNFFDEISNENQSENKYNSWITDNTKCAVRKH